jgi:LmbE family N-acetylglucosaminyl deacetylase
MELTCGALLLKESLRGDRVVILHLTLGERGNPARRVRRAETA